MVQQPDKPQPLTTEDTEEHREGMLDNIENDSRSISFEIDYTPSGTYFSGLTPNKAAQNGFFSLCSSVPSVVKVLFFVLPPRLRGRFTA
jgi:hypothetical protein